ncbi:hypothetical protein THF5H11_100121 [Vibrio jasicida]|uniref:Uncharacterized protein n=1 Tax=Vibrio jasicida TaxID=766224 RepID=A0AAU9QP27_9VIBR|nr:hypothetical protein THF5H11_100121 [Vibrio jasicida]CAH1592268.1 hypothetical protein THF1C08_310065 [Vibrio jasicida]CAH1597228.1 hypothetical protein THF1A12_310064 [Vibrio jasicida]
MLTKCLQLSPSILRVFVNQMLTFVRLEAEIGYNNKCSMELSEQARERKKVKTC